jgi:DNA-binding ferritin-like protein
MDPVWQAVWHDPTSYDALIHGPPYLPTQKLSSEDRSEVRAFARKTADDLRYVTSGTTLFGLLAWLHATSFVHQAHHWNTRGQQSYQDHLLFERIYKDSQEGIDSLAERAVTLEGPLPLVSHVKRIHEIIDVNGLTGQSASEMLKASLNGESGCLGLLERLMSVMTLSHGTSNLLEGIADQHEVFIYLLKQRLAPMPGGYAPKTASVTYQR